MAPDRHGSAVIEFPNDLDVVLTRKFDAPLQLVYDVLTKTEHLRKTLAPFDEEITECSFDVRVGGAYRYTFVTPDGTACTFYGEFLEVDPPTRTVETWCFEGWPGVEAVESFDLDETDGVTTVRWKLSFRDQAGRDHMKKYDGIEANFDNLEDYLRALLQPEGGAADG